jgi:hypothetical protein
MQSHAITSSALLSQNILFIYQNHIFVIIFNIIYTEGQLDELVSALKVTATSSCARECSCDGIPYSSCIHESPANILADK